MSSTDFNQILLYLPPVCHIQMYEYCRVNMKTKADQHIKYAIKYVNGGIQIIPYFEKELSSLKNWKQKN